VDKKHKNRNLKTLLLYGAFGLAVAFAVTTLFWFIFYDLVQPLPMGVLIGILIAVAYKLFRDALKREQKEK